MDKNSIRLLAQDLIGRQLFGVKFEYKNRHGKITVQTLDSVVHIQGDQYKVIGDKDTIDIENCKPYLFSCILLEEEIEFYGQKICILDELAKKDIVIVQHKGTWLRASEYEIIDFSRYFDVLDTFHVDYRGLIQKDLAIQIEKDNNPYK